MAEGSLVRRISRPFVLQAVAISVAAVVSVLLAAAVIRHVLVTEALRMEADYFWERRAVDPSFPLPETRNLSGFLAPVGSDGGLPEGLRGVVDGFHDVPSGADFTTVYVTRRDGQRLYLVFDGERVNELAAYFGLLPLAVVLLVLYLSVWLAFRASHRAVSPITRLAREVNRLDLDSPAARRLALHDLPDDTDDEIRVLAAALDGLANRLDAFVERERTFTRDASHELRTPLTVVRVATDILLERPDLPAAARDGIERIRRSSDEMERLVEAFLLLARESDQGLPQELVDVNAIVDRELDKLELLLRGKAVEVRVEAPHRLLVEGNRQALAVVIGNLLRNAFAYTDEGQVEVQIGRDAVTISDSGVGMDAQDIKEVFRPYYRGQPQRRGGHGVGLTIVRRFADRFSWSVAIDSRPGEGTRVRVGFPHARCGAHDETAPG